MNYPIRDVQFFGNAFQIYDTRPRWPWDDTEPPMHKYWSRIKPGDVVVDVGAAVGVYSLTALAMGATVIAFEPSDLLLDILVKNIHLNGPDFDERFVLRSYALGDGTDDVAALEAEVFTKHYPATNVVHRTLDYALDAAWPCYMRPPKWCKLDVEGAEYHVLNGARKTLARWHPTVILEDHEGLEGDTEVSRYPRSINSSQRCQTLLRDLGYDIEIMPHGGGRQYICAEYKK